MPCMLFLFLYDREDDCYIEKMIATSFWTSETRGRAFSVIASADAIELFAGAWPVPGIDQVDILSTRQFLVRDSWGLYHREQIVQVGADKKLVFHIKPNWLIRLLVGSISEEWLFHDYFGGTLVQRTLSFSRPRKLPLRLFRAAIDRNNKALAAIIGSTRTPQRPLPLT